MEITITEALAELKTIAARVKKNRDAIVRYAFRAGNLKDPLEKDGGSEKFVAEKRQANRDLLKRFVDIRIAIQSTNLVTRLTMQEMTMSVQEWLTWRKDIAKGEDQFLTALTNQLDVQRQAVARSPLYAKAAEGSDTKDPQLTVSFSEKELAETVDKLQKLLGDLDGQLSLLNATTKIEIP